MHRVSLSKQTRTSELTVCMTIIPIPISPPRLWTNHDFSLLKIQVIISQFEPMELSQVLIWLLIRFSGQLRETNKHCGKGWTFLMYVYKFWGQVGLLSLSWPLVRGGERLTISNLGYFCRFGDGAWKGQGPPWATMTEVYPPKHHFLEGAWSVA